MRARDALAIETMRDDARALSVGKCPKDPLYDARLLRVDRALAVHGRAVGGKLPDDVVTIGVPSAGEALAHPAFEPATGLDREVLEEKRVHGAFEADMQLADLAFRQGEDADAGEGQLLVEGGDVFLVARQAIERLGNHHIEGAGSGIGQHGLVAGAKGGSPLIARSE